MVANVASSQKSLNSLLPLSVIIITELRRLEDMHRCLQSLVEQKTNQRFDVLIVAFGDGKIDLHPWTKKGLNILIVKVRENNYCLKRNVGARKAKGRIIAYIDDDTVLKPMWVDAIIAGYAEEWKMGGGRVEPIFEIPIPPELMGKERFIGGFNYLPERDYSSKTVIGCNMFFDREWLLETGGFDEFIGMMNMTNPRTFLGGDEIDVKARLQPQQIGFVPQAHVYHRIQKERINTEYIMSRTKGMGRTRYYIDQKHGITRHLFLKKYFYLLLSIFRIEKKWYYRRKYCYIIGYFHEKHVSG